MLFSFCWKRKKKPELVPEVKVLKGNRMTSKTRNTGPCNYCVVKCKVLLDCPLFGCLLAELKAHWVGEGRTLLVTGAEGLLTTRTHLFKGKRKLSDPHPFWSGSLTPTPQTTAATVRSSSRRLWSIHSDTGRDLSLISEFVFYCDVKKLFGQIHYCTAVVLLGPCLLI